MFEGVDVDLVFRVRDGRAHDLRADFEQIGPSGQHLLFTHPDDGRLELISNTRRRIDGCQDIAAADINLVGERKGDRLPGYGDIEIAVVRHDAADHALLARWQYAQLVTGAH